jgi:hypothetical protein
MTGESEPARLVRDAHVHGLGLLELAGGQQPTSVLEIEVQALR